jgi:hypothetical protein
MIRKKHALGYDPMGVQRFSEKIMLKQSGAIPSNRIMIEIVVPCRASKRKYSVGFDLLHHRIRPRFPDIGKRKQDLSQKSAVGRHAADPRLDQVIKAAGNHMALDHLRSPSNRIGEPIEYVGSSPMKRHLDEDEQAEADAFRIETGTKSVDVAVLLKALKPLASRRRRQTDLVREIDARDPTISLQNRENPTIQSVKSHSFLGWFACLP